MQTTRPMQIQGTEPEFWQNPHAALKEAREHHPLARLEVPPSWLVLRYADVERLLADARLASAYTGLAEGNLERLLGGFLAAREGADHSRLRALVVKAFTPRRIDEVRTAIRDAAAALLGAVPRGEPFDFQAVVADRLTSRVIAALLGVPAGDEEVFARWTGGIMAGLSPLADPGVRAAAEEAAGELYGYLDELAERRRRAPGERLLDALIAAESDGHRLSPAELQDMVMSLLIGGHDTVRGVLSSITWLALAHPGTLDWLRGDEQRAAATVEEGLRFEPPLLGVPRVAVAPLVVGDVEIAAGDSVLLELTSANRDPRRFADPDRFDPARSHDGHLAFGHGLHFCVGAALARAEARELLLALAEEAPRLELVETPRWVPFSPARRLEALTLRA